MWFSWQNAKRYYVFRSILCIDAELETSGDFFANSVLDVSKDLFKSVLGP